MFKSRADFFRRWGPVYWSLGSYRLTMALLRPRGREPMYQTMIEQIGHRTVLELCCGTGELARRLDGVSYQGIDRNPVFVRALKSRRLNVQEADVMKVPWPEADCLVMIDSLYHFLPDLEPLMERLRRHPARRVILSESVQNLALSSRPWLVNLARWATRVDGSAHPGRFTETSLLDVYQRYGFNKMIRRQTNWIGILDKP